MTTNATSAPASQAAELADLVDQAIARVKAHDSAGLDELIQNHPDHADELQRLLPAVQVMADLSRSGEPGATAPGEFSQQLGELGDFRIIREVGRGGMGVVYEAEQISLRRRVALKVLPFAATMDLKQLQRFRNEALAAASLHHEHIVPVHAVGSERGVHYYAMQFIDGHTLADLITARLGAARPVSKDITTDFQPGGDVQSAPVAALTTRPDRAIGRAAFRQSTEWIAQAADALEYAHSMGIVHRDMKPGNLMVDAAGKLWVADFGLARFGADAGLTMSGDLLGTLRYMAPEQALARHGLADHRVDVYGLGCTLYELLTGKPAVRGEDKADILRHIAFEEPVAPRKLDKRVPIELDTIALKCLAKNPNERYVSAGELAADLRLFLADKPIKAKPPSVRQATARWIRRHKALAASTALVLMAAAMMLAGSIGYVLRDRAARLALTEQKATTALTSAQTAIEAGDLALGGRHIAEARGHIGGDRDGLPELAAEIDRAQAEIDVRQADAVRFQRFINLADDAQDRMGFEEEFDGGLAAREALAKYAVLDEDDWLSRVQNSTLTAAQKLQVRETAYIVVVSLADFGRRWEAQWNPDSVQLSMDLLRKAKTFHEPTRSFYFVRSDCYRRQGNADAANADATQFESEPAQTAWDHYLPGRARQMRHDLVGAMRSYRAALTMQPNHYNALFFLAQCLERKSDFAEALGLFSACLALSPVQGQADVYAHRSFCNRQLGHTEAADADYAAAMTVNSDSAKCQWALANALAEHRQFEDEIAVRRRAVALEPKKARFHLGLAKALSKHGDHDEAAAILRRCIDAAPQEAVPKHQQALLQNDLGTTFLRRGKYAEAEAAFHSAVALEANNLQAHNNLGVVLDRLGRHKEAEAAFRKAIALKSGVCEVHANLGLCLIYQERMQEAEDSCRKAIALNPDSPNTHANLAFCFKQLGEWEKAAVEYQAAIDLKSDETSVEYNFAEVLNRLGRFAESLAACKRGQELASKRPGAELPKTQWVRETEQLAALEAKLPAVLSGESKPADAMEQARLGLICRSKRRYVAATRFYSAAFASDPKLATDCQSQYTFDAACSAVLASAGQGSETDKLDDVERGRLRQLALELLTVRLAGKAKLADEASERANVRDGMRTWQTFPDLAGVRDPAKLAKLPDAERVTWEKFWAEVAALKKHAEEPPGPQKPPTTP